MKRFFVLLLALSLALTALVSCGGSGDSAPVGYYKTAEGDCYFFADGGAVHVTDKATATTYTYERGNITVDGKTFAVSDLTAMTYTAPLAAKEYFTYETLGNGRAISGLTELGKAQTVLFVPKDVQAVKRGAFSGATGLRAVVIGEGVGGALQLLDGAFSGTTGLHVYIACGTTNVSAGENLASDTASLSLYILSSQYENFKNDYTWSKLSSLMKKY